MGQISARVGAETKPRVRNGEGRCLAQEARRNRPLPDGRACPSPRRSHRRRGFLTTGWSRVMEACERLLSPSRSPSAPAHEANQRVRRSGCLAAPALRGCRTLNHGSQGTGAALVVSPIKWIIRGAHCSIVRRHEGVAVCLRSRVTLVLAVAARMRRRVRAGGVCPLTNRVSSGRPQRGDWRHTASSR